MIIERKYGKTKSLEESVDSAVRLNSTSRLNILMLMEDIKGFMTNLIQ